jgi:hypothetical protein
MKTYKVSKVDQLRHIKEHGLNVLFSDTKLVFMMKTIAETPFGSFKLESGQSQLEILRHGEVTRVYSFFSVGSYSQVSWHYFSPSEGLKFSDKPLNPSSEECDALDCSVFGKPLPSFFRPSQGEQADTLAGWLRTNAWRMHGVAGLRAQALEIESSKRARELVALEQSLRREEARLFGAKNWPETFAARKERTLETRKVAFQRLQRQETDFAEYNLEGKARALGASQTWSHPNPKQNLLQFSAMPEVWSHPDQRANYSATVTPEGKIELSSGIVCPFDLATLRSWLESGRNSELPTPYGRVNLLEVREYATPTTLLQAGCHRVNPADFGEDVAGLCKPNHEVKRLAGIPAISIEDMEAFSAEVLRRSEKKLADIEQAKRQAMHDCAETLAELEKTNANAPAYLAECQKSRDAAYDDFEAFKAKPAEFVPAGATLANLQELSAVLVGAFIRPASNQLARLSN